jgi:hypothetical protein
MRLIAYMCSPGMRWQPGSPLPLPFRGEYKKGEGTTMNLYMPPFRNLSCVGTGHVALTD